jgi:hypothetical protein
MFIKIISLLIIIILLFTDLKIIKIKIKKFLKK